MTAAVIDFNKARPDLLEARQNMTQPADYAPRRLLSYRDEIPATIAGELADRFAGLFSGVGNWIGLCKEGYVYAVDIIQTGPDSYDYDIVLGRPAYSEGPQAA